MSIMLRAEITPAEWKQLRKLAIDLERPIQAVVADALRAYLGNHLLPQGEK